MGYVSTRSVEIKAAESGYQRTRWQARKLRGDRRLSRAEKLQAHTVAEREHLTAADAWTVRRLLDRLERRAAA